MTGSPASPNSDSTIAGGSAELYGSSGDSAGGTGSVAGEAGGSPAATKGTGVGGGGGEIGGGEIGGGEIDGGEIDGGEIDGRALMPSAGGAATDGGVAVGDNAAGEGGNAAGKGGNAAGKGGNAAGKGGNAAGGAAAAWDGWMMVRVGQGTECVSAGQPLTVEVHVGQAAESLAVFGTRTVEAPAGTEECLLNFVDDRCVVAEEFGVSLSGADAEQVMESFSSLPSPTCINDGVQCEMPCNAPTLEIDGTYRGSTFCCGTFDDPDFARRAQAAIDLLMALADARLAASGAE